MPRRQQQQRAGRSVPDRRHSLFRCRIGPARSAATPHFPTSSRRSSASLATIPGSVYTNHARPDSPLELGITLCLSPLAALRSKGSLLFPPHALCFAFPIPKPPSLHQHHITMGSIGEEPAKCPMRVANTAAGGTKVLPVLHRQSLHSMLTRQPEP